MSNPIPKNKLIEFKSYMEAFDFDDLADGAWFQVLEDAAEKFIKMHKIKGDANDAVHQYIRLNNHILTK